MGGKNTSENKTRSGSRPYRMSPFAQKSLLLELPDQHFASLLLQLSLQIGLSVQLFRYFARNFGVHLFPIGRLPLSILLLTYLLRKGGREVLPDDLVALFIASIVFTDYKWNAKRTGRRY
uniref:Uncharacterized protein n=1 Tax=Anopheles atroparvus TaxID=41427 RepID=A0A182JGE3_ANOAO